jgi:two-component system, OmpR family, response regulator
MGKVLVVDDDAGIRGLLRRALSREGHVVLVAPTGLDGIRAATETKVDLVVLDLGLPDLDGSAVLAALAGGPRVMVLSADSAADRRVECFDRGAVDFVAKPFALRELLARIRMRASEGTDNVTVESTMKVGTVVVDLIRHHASVNGVRVELSPREFRVLEYLMRNRTRVCSRDEILTEVWGYRPGPGSNVVDVTVRRLRSKLGQADVVDTVRHVGYCVG